MSDKDDIKLGIGGEVNDSYKGALETAGDLAKDFAKDWIGVMAEVAKGTPATVAFLQSIKEGVMEKVLGPLAILVLKLELVNQLFEAFRRNSEEAKEGLTEFANVEDMETQFKSILRSASDAKQRVKELRETAEGTPFKFEDVAGASKSLQLQTGGQLASGEGLQSVLDVAAKTGAPLRETADAIGRLYQTIQAGEPLARAARELEHLGIMSEQERLDLEKLQQSGKSAGDVWAEFTKRSLDAAGATVTQAQTLQALNDKLKESQKEMSRQVGDVYADQAKENVKATTDLTKALTPLEVEAAKLKQDFGLTGMPTQTFPIFDTQIKGLLTTVASAREEWKLFIDGLGVAAVGAVASTIASFWKKLSGFAGGIRDVVLGTQEWAEANKVATAAEWTTTEGVKANTAALLENGAAGLRANAVLLLQKGSLGLIKTAWEALMVTTSEIVMALLSRTGLVVSALAAIYEYYQKTQEYISRLQQSVKDGIDAIQQTEAERQAIVSTEDKVKALTAAYERLAVARKALAEAPDSENGLLNWARQLVGLAPITDSMEKTIARMRVAGMENKFNQTELAQPTQQSKEEQDIVSQLGDLQEKQLERDLSPQEELLHLEQQRSELAEKRVLLEKAAADAAAKVAPEMIKAQQEELAGLQKQLEASQARVDQAKKVGGMFGEGWAQTDEQPLQLKLLERISQLQALQQGRAGDVAASQTAQVDLKQNDLQGATMDDRIVESRKRQSREDYSRAEREAEAATERDILELQTRGVQKTIDEAKLRQSLAATKLADMQADQQRLTTQEAITAQIEAEAKTKLDALSSTGTQRLTDEKTIRDQRAVDLEKAAQQGGVLFTKEEQRAGILSAQNEYLSQQRTINEALLAQGDEKLSQEERRVSRLESLVSKLPKFMQKSYVQQELGMSDQEANDLQARADKARKAGDTTAADEFQNRADSARDRSAELKDQLAVWNNTPLMATVDAQQKLGEGGRIAHGSSSSLMVGTENKLQRIIDILERKPVAASHPPRGNWTGGDNNDPGFRIV